jgi:hypothetical protein
MTKDKALKLVQEALVALENISTALREDDVLGSNIELMLNTIAAIREALAQPYTVQVSPLEFVTRVTGKEEIIGEPAFWAQWPSKEKNT